MITLNNKSYKSKEKFIKLFLENPIFKPLFLNKMQNTILMYHGVTSFEKNEFNTRHIGAKTFKNQMIFLKKNCHIISLDDFFEKKFKKNKINISITFDDGYENNFKVAKPILEELKIPATFYITGLNQVNNQILWADFIDIASRFQQNDLKIENTIFKKIKNEFRLDGSEIKLSEYIKKINSSYEFKIKMQESFNLNFENTFENNKYKEYWKLMTNDQIVETGKSKYISIGSHGYFHNNLGNISFENAKIEIQNSKDYLSSLINKNITSIGYPDGSYSRDIIDFCNQNGFTTQVAAEGYLYEEDLNDPRIIDRKGIYCNSDYRNQLFAALKK